MGMEVRGLRILMEVLLSPHSVGCQSNTELYRILRGAQARQHSAHGYADGFAPRGRVGVLTASDPAHAIGGDGEEGPASEASGGQPNIMR